MPGAFKTVINNKISEKVIDFFKNKLLVVSDFTLKKTSLTFTSVEKSDKNFMLWNDPSVNTKGAQLIFTTHNPIYLNNQIFRRDQIKFVEKDKDTFESTIYSLADFGSTDVRNDQNYLLNYFKGKYGTLPYIDFTRLIKSISDKSKD